MVTYVNNLGLSEIATGDSAGNWGVLTNTSLELIGEALGYATEQSFGSDANATSAVDDGATSPVRSIYFKVTSAGSLTATRQLTITPDTIKRLMFIENATTGSQSITIKQGSGAGAAVTIPNGDTKAVILPGSGTGSIVLDAFASLSVVDLKVQDDLTVTGDLDVDGTTNLDAVDIDGAVQIDNTLSVGVNDTGYDVKFFGDTASAYMLWDASADDLILGGAAGLSVNSAALVTGILTTTAATVSNGGGQFNGAINVGVDGTGYDVKFFGDTATNGYMLWDQSTDDLILGSSSRLGIGTSSPSGALHVQSNNIGLYLTATAGTDNTYSILSSGTNGESLEFADVTSSRRMYLLNDEAHYFYTAGTEALRIDASGNIIIANSGGTLYTTTAGTSNFRAGVNAGNSIAAVGATNAGSYNTVVGDEAGTAITTAEFNTAVGFLSLDGNTTGDRNTAVGAGALGTMNVTDGSHTLNTAVGFNAGTSVSTGTHNTLIGGLAGDALTTGASNVAVGYGTLGLNVLGSKSTAIGVEALARQNPATAVDMFNVAIGIDAGYSVTTGVQNTLVGANAGDAITTGDQNVSMGMYSLSQNTASNKNVGLGYAALSAFNVTTDTDTYNVAVGSGAGAAVTSGIQNTLIGGLAGDALTDADFNIALGVNALSTDTLGSKSTALGYDALGVQNFTTATDSFNTAVGFEAGRLVTTGVQNTLIGGLAGDALTTGASNVAVGYNALSLDTAGKFNVAIGEGSLASQNNTGTDIFNTAVGYAAGNAVSSGTQNTFFGGSAGSNITTGTQNVYVGYSPSGSAVGNAREIVIGNGVGAGSNSARFITTGGSLSIAIDGSTTSWTAASDSRLKKDVTDSTVGLEFIKDLRPVTFKWNSKNAIADSLPQYDADSSDPVYGEGKAHHGFIAQEVKTVIDAHSDVVNGHNIWVEDPNGTQQVAPAALIPMLVKAVQEQNALIESLTARIAVLEG